MNKIEDYFRGLLKRNLPEDWQIWVETECGSDEEQIFTIKDIKELISRIDDVERELEDA